MVVHVYQVHKETISKVPNSKPGRDSVKYEIYGMEGIPDGEEEDSPNKKLKTDSTPLLPTPGTPGFPGAVPPYMQPGYSQQWGFAQQAPPPQSGATITSPPMAPRPAPLFPIQPGIPPPMPVMPGMAQPAPFATGPSHHVPGGPPSPTAFNFAPPPLHGAPHALPPHASQHIPLPHPNQPLPSQQHPSQPPNTSLIYDDEITSMEEKRAEHPRYRYDEEKIKQQMNRLDQSIEFRVSQIGSRIGL